MKSYHFNKELLDLINLDKNKTYVTTDIMDVLFKNKKIRKYRKNKSTIPSRRILIKPEFHILLNHLSYKINPHLKLLYSNKVTLSVLSNFLWRFVDDNTSNTFPNKLLESLNCTYGNHT